MAVARYIVRDRGMSCGAGRFESGKFVYEPWLDGQGGRLARLGVVVLAGEVDDDDPVLDRDCTVGHPGWLGAVVGSAEPPVEFDLEDDEDPAVFDLSTAKTADVIAHVEDHPDELEAVLAAELEGKNRVGLVRELTARVEAAAGEVE